MCVNITFALFSFTAPLLFLLSCCSPFEGIFCFICFCLFSYFNVLLCDDAPIQLLPSVLTIIFVPLFYLFLSLSLSIYLSLFSEVMCLFNFLNVDLCSLSYSLLINFLNHFVKPNYIGGEREGYFTLHRCVIVHD